MLSPEGNLGPLSDGSLGSQRVMPSSSATSVPTGTFTGASVRRPMLKMPRRRRALMRRYEAGTAPTGTPGSTTTPSLTLGCGARKCHLSVSGTTQSTGT